jgi:surface protein
MKKIEKTYQGNILIESELNEKGERHGITRIHHENGELQVELNWTNGIQDDGTIISYHDNGIKARQVIRLRGEFNGEFSEWYENGQLKIEGIYSNGLSNILKEWNRNGLLVDFKTLKFNTETLRVAVKEWLDDEKLAESKYGHISNWDVCNVTDMDSIFRNASSFNQPLNDWNTSNVTNMEAMFYNAESFNQPLNDWNTSNVANMEEMFRNAKFFNQLIVDWDVSNVINMKFMFYGAKSFNQPIGDWDVSSVKYMNYMFDDAESFNQPIGDWDISNVKFKNTIFLNEGDFGYKGYNKILEESKLKLLSVSTDLSFPREESGEYFFDDWDRDFINENIEEEPIWFDNQDNDKSLSMIVTFSDIQFSDHPNIDLLGEKADNSIDDFQKDCKKFLRGKFEMPVELKNQIEVVGYNFGSSYGFQDGNEYLTFDTSCDVSFSIKTSYKEAIKEIDEFQKKNHDLRWNLSIYWGYNN